MMELVVQSRHLPLVVRGVAAGMGIQTAGEAEGRAGVALHPGLFLQAALELGTGGAALVFREGGAALGLRGLGRCRVALGAEGGALGPEAGLGLDAAGGRAGVGLGRLDGTEEVLYGVGIICKRSKYNMRMAIQQDSTRTISNPTILYNSPRWSPGSAVRSPAISAPPCLSPPPALSSAPILSRRSRDRDGPGRRGRSIPPSR